MIRISGIRYDGNIYKAVVVFCMEEDEKGLCRWTRKVEVRSQWYLDRTEFAVTHKERDAIFFELVMNALEDVSRQVYGDESNHVAWFPFWIAEESESVMKYIRSPIKCPGGSWDPPGWWGSVNCGDTCDTAGCPFQDECEKESRKRQNATDATKSPTGLATEQIKGESKENQKDKQWTPT